MRRITPTVLTLFVLLIQTAAAFQEVHYKGRLEPELISEQPMGAVTLTAATDQDKRLLPAVAEGDTVYVGEMRIGQGQQRKTLKLFVIKSSDEKRLSYLYVDLNEDGKLTADERVDYNQDTGAGSPTRQAVIRLPLMVGFFKSYPIRLSLPMGGTGGNGPGPKGPILLQSIFTVARGTVDIEGRRTLVEYSVSPTGELDPAEGKVAVDCDGDGKIDRNPFGSLETLIARNESVVFHVDKHYVSTKSVDMKSGEIILRAHPASDYTRIELRTGAEVPDFTFVDFQGKSRKLSDFRGKYVLLDFWGTWCGPCVAQIPHLKEAYEKYRDRGFEILGMDHEVNEEQTTEKVRQFLSEKGVTWIGATSESIDDLVEKRFRISAYPTTILLDPQGRILKPGSGLIGQGLMITLGQILPAK